MGIIGISSAFSANSLISGLGKASRPARISGIESPDTGFQPKLVTKQKTPSYSNIGPGVAELTPAPASVFPPAFFKNEYAPDKLSTKGDKEEIFEKEESKNSEIEENQNDSKEKTKNTQNEELSEEEKQEVEKLKARDAEVATHENAHKSVAGSLSSGGPVYEYTKGPDGRQYKTGGHVTIKTGKGDSPQETLNNARIIQRAALAPASPSPQDRSVAASAAKMENEALSEMQKESVANPEKNQKSQSLQTDDNPSEPQKSQPKENASQPSIQTLKFMQSAIQSYRNSAIPTSSGMIQFNA